MRGCLVTLALLVTVAVLAVWFLLPPLVGTLAQGALAAAGFQAATTTVTVTADPPPKLLGLTADAIRIRASNARYRGLEAVDVDVTLDDVRLIDRTFGGLSGTLAFVSLPGAGGSPRVTIPEVALSGDAERVRATLTFPAATAEELASSALERATGITSTKVVLSAPDRVRIEGRGLVLNGRLAVRSDGALLLVPPAQGDLGSITLVTPGPDVPLRIDSFRIVDGGLVLVATLDPAAG